jgi:hypothetical protein
MSEVEAKLLNEVRGRLEALAHELLPVDFAGRPFYVVFSVDLPDGFTGDSIDGGAGPVLDVALRDAIGPRWQGRGPAIYVRLHRETLTGVLAEHATSGLPAAWPAKFLTRYLAPVVIHETAHQAEDDRTFAGEPEAFDVQKSRDWLHEMSNGLRPKPTGPTAPVPFKGHEWEFLRAAAHLTDRARRTFGSIDGANVVSHNHYQVSPLDAYIDALAEELVDADGLTYADVRRRRPPQAFVDLWQSDFRRWFLSHPNPSKEVTDALRVAACFIPSPASQESP